MNRQVIINITLVGTEGQLDKKETDYNVRYLKDSLSEASREATKQAGRYSDYGWTYIVGIREN